MNTDAIDELLKDREAYRATLTQKRDDIDTKVEKLDAQISKLKALRTRLEEI